MLDYANHSKSTFFDLSPLNDTSVLDRLDSIREAHEKLDEAIRNQQMSIETTRSLVYR